MLNLSIFVSLSAIFFALYLIFQVRKNSSGSKEIQKISGYISEGADAFMKREFRVLAIALSVLAVILFFLESANLAVVFLAGAFISALTGYIGMKIATQANGRCCNAALSSFSKSFRIAYNSGSVMGMMVVGFGLLGLLLVWSFFRDPNLLVGYAFGASLVGLFLRVGGGIYTKAADVGADLVGKIEVDIPEDDPRNPAVIADAVGDNVGDVAGMGADLFESYVSAISASIIIGVPLFGDKGLILPILLASAGIVSSIIGNFFVKIKKEKEEDFQKQTEQIRNSMFKGQTIANVLMIISAWVICHYYGNNNLFFALISGLLAGILIGEVTKYYTSDKYKPVLEIAKISKSGTSLNIIEGLSQGMISTAVPTLAVVGAMIVAFDFAGLYGIALAAVGILATLGINLSSDCYGPIVDNAAGISAMAGLPSDVRQKTDALDSVGNTTAATGKGFAIGSAALAALAWITVFFEKAGIDMVNIIDPRVIGGFFIGGALSFFFCAITMKAVSRGAFLVVGEVRRQFKEIKGIMKGKEKPEYSKCVDLITKKALKEMILPGFLAISVPILTGVILGIEALGGLLLGALVSGFLLAVMMSNAGGAWDNAKKYIEMGNLDGKGSEAHKASIIGDTVGDPMKDTSGPSLNILIKLVGEVSVIFMPLFLLLK